MVHSTKPLLGLLVASLVSAASAADARYYNVEDTFVGQSFLDGFEHHDFTDPAGGRVNYVDQDTAVANNLTFAKDDTFIMRADSTKTLDPASPGRDSVRISSKKQYGTGVLVLDLRHMPAGCGTWPAFWTNSNNNTWPEGGEIDILEGVNDEGPNVSVLHTSATCNMTASNMAQTGQLTHPDCTSNAGDGTGCVVEADNPLSFGPPLNAVGGGWYAMERSASFISVWFWSRNDTSVPDEVRNAAGSKNKVNPASWGTPYANFVNNGCDFDGKFKPQNIIFSLGLCGDWADDAYPCDCPSTCVDNVNNNPEGFKDAYWDIASLTVFAPASMAARHIHHRRHHQPTLFK